METLTLEAPVQTTVARRPAPRAAVVALGSVVMGDDGAGAAALATLEARYALPAGVEVLDLGTPGPYLAEYLRGYEAVIVLDTVRMPGAPGSLHVLSGEDFRASASPRLTPHSPDLGAALADLALRGEPVPEVTVLGVVPGRVAAGTDLSLAVDEAVPFLATLAVAALRDLGHDLPRRPDAPRPAFWWQHRLSPEAPQPATS
jgi:hydrogenase maturation protease